METVGRNQPCPCGSGRRYKECHGVVNVHPADSPAAPAEPSQQSQLGLLMRQALALQQEGRLADAIAKYETVVARQPGNFDALHMLGVAWFQSNQLDRAEHYVDRALAIRPDIIAAKSNRALIDDARRLAAMEADLCRQVLPRMARLSRGNRADWPMGARDPLDIVVAARALSEEDLRMIRRIVGDPHFRSVVWKTRYTAAISELEAGAGVQDVDADPGPVSARMLVYGCDIPAAAWIRASVPAHVAVLVNADMPCALLDRIRELTDQGRSPVTIIFSRAEIRAASGLPGLLIEEWLAAVPLQ